MAMEESHKESKTDSGNNAKWIILLTVIIATITTTTILNTNHDQSTTTKIESGLDIDNGDSKINWARYSTYDIKLTESLNITKSGVYHLTGSLADGSISIKVGTEGIVKLILDNVSITNSNGPAIACYEADDLVVEVVGNNTLADGSTYSTDYDDDVSGSIYSKADLTFTGSGTLDVTGNYLDAIVGKDDVKFDAGTYYIEANDDGIRGKDSVYIVGGNFDIKSTGDAIKTTNETDSGKGFILIEDGNFKINSVAKGFKATNAIIIRDGNYAITSKDDSIHSNDYVSIVGGQINITSGDDGIHADNTLIIDGGSIVIARSYEGLEAQVITINDGKLSITSNDDGINAGGGVDASANNRPGAGAFDADENCVLSINGGEVYINAAGDGVDSNGWLYFNGGDVVVDGPTNNGNGALDAGMGIITNGGTVIAVGSSGMAESLGASSAVNNVSIYLDSTAPAGTLIEIRDSNNSTILTHTSAKSFNHIAAGTSQLALGQSYSLYLNGELSQTFIVSGITTTVGNNYNQAMPGGNNYNQAMPGGNQSPTAQPRGPANR